MDIESMAVFENCSLLLDTKTLPFKEKKKLVSAITTHGGHISFVVNKQLSLVVTNDVSNLSSNRLSSIRKYQTPVVGVDYVYGCVDRGDRLPVDKHILETSSPPAFSQPLPPSSLRPGPPSDQVPVRAADVGLPKGQAKPADPASPIQWLETPAKCAIVLEKFRIYTETDSDLPSFPDHFQVAMYSIFRKVKTNNWFVLELQSSKGEKGQLYRVVRYWMNGVGGKREVVKDMLVFLSTSEESVEVYQVLREILQLNGLRLCNKITPEAPDLGSSPLHQLLLEEQLHTASLSQEAGVFVELLWTEALGHLCHILRVPIDQLSLNDVSRAEGLLLLAQRKLREAKLDEVVSLLREVFVLLPHRLPTINPDNRFISQKLDLCQLIRDVLNSRERTLGSPTPSCLGKYLALRCCIESVPPCSTEFEAVTSLLQNRKLKIQQVLRVGRVVELQTFKSELGNIKPLLHSSSPSNFVGILSRGLLLPHAGVEHHGIERTDIGHLGSGIYFGDAVSTILKYSKPSLTDGSRILLVCDVALGSCCDVLKRDLTLTKAPRGHHSVHGVRSTPNTQSEFEDDEYVVYSPDQVKLKYAVQFSIEGDQLKEFSPAVDTSPESFHPSLQLVSSEEDGIEIIKNPLDDVTAGLLDSSGQQLPLQAVHVKCKLMDLVSQVIIFQKYTNTSSVAIEAKYVFPLDDSAAVCGFEAFINGKHVVGQVKEKWTARKEYKQAIERGHGAYLMDQDAPDVFTISVGNLPPGASVLIKVTFVSELIVKDGSILFSLPGSVAPWQESAALNQTTQITVEKVCVTDDAASTREFTLDMSIEMHHEIKSLQCITHKVKTKRTDCKAVVSVLPGEVMGAEGFQLSVTLSDVHQPRMWVEKHPDMDSQACMLVFYPDFDNSSSSEADEVVLLLDTSGSMKGESLLMAQRIALQVLKSLGDNQRVNVILFNTVHSEAFQIAEPLVNVRQKAESFIKEFYAKGGNTELWRPLRALSLLPPSRGIRNLLLLSDGHIHNAELTLQLLRDNVQHSRLFVCGLSPTANRHMLRALAQAGGGAHEFFDTKMKHNWAEKVARQVTRMASPGCSSVSVKWQQFNPTSPVTVQAPKQLHALFNDCHTLVYGFVPYCTQATLFGNLGGQELKTMVSTSELQMTRGTLLHKLTARALIRDYEDGSLDMDEAEHEGKKATLKSFIIELSKEFSILSQFTSFLAVEERDSEQPQEGFTDIPKLIAGEDVDFLPYVRWTQDSREEEEEQETQDEVGFSELEDLCIDLEQAEEKDLLDIIMDSLSCREDSPMGVLSSPVALPSAPSRKGAKKAKPRIRSMSLTKGLLEDTSELSARESCGPGYINRERVHHTPPPPPPYLYRSLVAQGSAFPTPPPPPPPPAASLPVLQGPGPLSPDTGSSAKSVAPSSIRDTGEIAMGYKEKNRRVYRKSVSMSRSLSSFAPPPPPPPPPHINPPSVAQDSASPTPPPPPPPPAASVPVLQGPDPLSLDSGSYFKRKASFSRHNMMKSALRCREREGSARSTPVPEICSQSSFSAPPPAPPRLYRPKYGLASAFPSPPPPAPPRAVPVLQGTSPNSIDRGSSLGSCSYDIGERTMGRSGLFGSAATQKRVPAPMDIMLETNGNATEFSVESGLPLTMEAPLLQQFGQGRRLLADFKSTGFSCTPGSPLPQGQSMMNTLQFGRAKLEILPSGNSFRKSLILAGSLQASNKNAIFKCRDEPRPCRGGPKLMWDQIFQMQHPEGYWELTTELGVLIHVNVDVFANVFLKNKGILSLGVRAHGDILKLVATLLVLQLMRLEKLEEGKLLRTLFCLSDSSWPRPERWDEVRRAVQWACWAERQYPCIYSRLEFGRSWESSTRQLLGYEDLPHFSPLSGLDLRSTAAPLLVH